MIKETLTQTFPGKPFREGIHLVPSDWFLYGKGPKENQYQAQTQLSIHDLLYCNRKTNGGQKKIVLTSGTKHSLASIASFITDNNKLGNSTYDLMFQNQNRTR